MELGSDPTEINSTKRKLSDLKKESVFKKPHKIINIIIPSHYGKLKHDSNFYFWGGEDH